MFLSTVLFEESPFTRVGRIEHGTENRPVDPCAKGLKGSGRQIVDPLESIIRNCVYLRRSGREKQRGRGHHTAALKGEGSARSTWKIDRARTGPFSSQLRRFARP